MQSIPRVVVTLAVVLLALLAGWWLWHFYMIAPWTRDARVRADVVTIAPDVSGWVVELKVRDNQQVKAGDLLMSIDRERYQAALDKARALAETRRQQLNLARSEVRAPRAGQVTNLHLAQGNYVQAGQAVMALVADESFYVQAYFEETKLPGIRVGAPAEVILMSGGEPLQGKVQSISRGITDRNAAADAQLLADVEPTFNWVRLAQRIPVRIELDELPKELLLSAGMTASVRVMEQE